MKDPCPRNSYLDLARDVVTVCILGECRAVSSYSISAGRLGLDA